MDRVEVTSKFREIKPGFCANAPIREFTCIFGDVWFFFFGAGFLSPL